MPDIETTIGYYENSDGTLSASQVSNHADFVVEAEAGTVSVSSMTRTKVEYDNEIAAIAASAVAIRAALQAEIDNVNGHVKLYRYLPLSDRDKRDVPSNINYITGITGRIHPTNTIIISGEIRQVDYYANASAPNAQGVITYDDLVIRETFAYTRDAMGFARARTQTITWYKEDGTPHAGTKTRVKYYENDESIREGQRRRKNITDTLSMTITKWLLSTQTGTPKERIDIGRTFLHYYKTSFNMFSDASSSRIIHDLVTDSVPAHAWIDQTFSTGVTVRHKMIDELNIWGGAL